MVYEITIEKALSSSLPIIDVRSPGEYCYGHIPEAENIPLFSDEERAIVGTTYKQKSQEAAIEIGYTFVNPKLDDFIRKSKHFAADGKIILHCERGGMRSQAFAKHLSDNGFEEVYVIVGGYKSYRRFVLESFSKPLRINVLGGYTGSGKTHILHELQANGNQIIDLESLACHKGSTFGGVGQKPQPTVEQFENNLYHKLKELNADSPVWIEDESHNIGRIEIPHGIFDQMQKADLYFLEIPKSERAKHLVTEYADCNTNMLKESVLHISKRLGGQNVKVIFELLDNNNFYDVALMTLDYYDKLYFKALQNKSDGEIFHIPLAKVDNKLNATILSEISRQKMED